VIRIGTAGWSIRADLADRFPGNGTHLQRHARRLGAAEINSSFYRPHRRSTYERWAEGVPDGFRFSVKAPKAITHEHRLEGCGALIDRFAHEIAGLGPKLGVVLVQLPPSLRFDEAVATGFFQDLHARTGAAIACEPRHASWFDGTADRALAAIQIARVAADPPPAAGADSPGGWAGLAYYRMHGSPRIYWSDYEEPALEALAADLAARERRGADVWCIFDNTAAGHAAHNALRMMDLSRKKQPCVSPPAATG
jgi:uncharacterized protein YecE (DUF72 family)